MNRVSNVCVMYVTVEGTQRGEGRIDQDLEQYIWNGG